MRGLRIFAVTLLAMLVGACGFRPLYATTQQADGRDLLDQVWITTIQGQSGVILRNYLLDGFYHHGYPQEARYQLVIHLAESVRDVDVQKNDTTTRAQYVTLANYDIRDRVANQSIDRGQVRSVAGYNILLSQYTTLVTQNDAKDRALKELADKIQTRTALVLSEPSLRMAPIPAATEATPSGLPANSVVPTDILPADGLSHSLTGTP